MTNDLKKRFENTLWAVCPIPEWNITVKEIGCDCCDKKGFTVHIDFGDEKPPKASLSQ